VHVDQFHCHQAASPIPAPASQDDLRSPGLADSPFGGSHGRNPAAAAEEAHSSSDLGHHAARGELAFAEIALGLVRRYHVDGPLPGRAKIKHHQVHVGKHHQPRSADRGGQ
jgi:hypothetical protein